MNSIVLIGRLTKDPELKYASGSQNAVVTFTLAVDRPLSKEKATDFLRIVAFGKQAENCEKFLVKGRKVGIQGKIQTGSYKTQSGDKKYTTEVIADRIEFLDWGDKKNENPGSESKPDDIPEGFEEFNDDDMPF